MAMKSLRESASGGLMKFFLMGLLAMAVGGLVFTDMGGFFRDGNIGSNNVAKIDGETIGIQTFDSRLSRLLSRAGITRYEAYAKGYIGQFLNEQIRETLVQQSARKLGITPHQDRAKDVIKTLIAPGVANGTDPETMLKQIISQQRMSEVEFIETLNNSIATEPLLNALRFGGSVNSPLIVGDILDYQNEQRNVSYVIYKNGETKNTAEPTDEQLRNLYEAEKETYASPETRDVQVIEIVFTAPEGMDENESLEEQYALADIVDDLAAGGSTPAEIAQESGAKLYNIKGLDYLSDKHDQGIVTTSFDLLEGEVSPVFETDEGKFVAISVQKINSKNYKPFEAVQNDIKKRWNSDQQAMNTKLEALAVANEIKEGKKKLSDLGKTVSNKTALTRQSENTAPFSPENVGAIFDAKLNDTIITPTKDGIAIAVITSSTFPERNNDDEATKAITENIQKSMEDEAVVLYLENRRKNMKISVNQGLIDRAYGTPPEDQ